MEQLYNSKQTEQLYSSEYVLVFVGTVSPIGLAEDPLIILIKQTVQS